MTLETTRVLTLDEVKELTAEQVTAVESAGTSMTVPEGMTPFELVDVIGVDSEVEFILEGQTLRLERKVVGTKGL